MTVAYFDTSAVIPLIINEVSSTACRRVWSSVERRVSSVVLWPESCSALAKAHRTGRLDDDSLRDAVERLERLIVQCELVNVGREAAESAASIALRFGLRGFDAVHVDAARRLHGDDFVAVTGDGQMASAWSRLGLTTINVTP